MLPGNMVTSPPEVSPASGANAAIYTKALTLGFPVAALVMTSPPYECPTRTMGPVMLARTLAMYAESLATPRSGFAGARTVYPRSCRRVMTPLQPEASAKAPWIRTIVGLGPLSSCAVVLTAVNLGWPADAPVPAKRINAAKADSTMTRVLLNLGLVVELRMFMTTS